MIVFLVFIKTKSCLNVYLQQAPPLHLNPKQETDAKGKENIM